MSDPRLYPYELIPKTSEAIWGGRALVTRYHKPGSSEDRIGESWECWDENRVAGGPLAGHTVAELRTLLHDALMGELDAQRRFPLLTKFIDARDRLSVQVHPPDAYAQRVEGEPNGKTECWYVLEAGPEAELYLGWRRDTDRTEYERRVRDGTLGELLRSVPVRAGQAFYLPAGTLHAIGAGIVLFETQQASDLTYRIFDWNRLGPDGKPRQLHIERAGDVLDFRAARLGAMEPLTYELDGVARTALIDDPRFWVERADVAEAGGEIALEGMPLAATALGEPLLLEWESGTYELEPFATVLVPAALERLRLAPSAGERAALLLGAPPPDGEALHRRLASAGVSASRSTAFLEQFTAARSLAG